ncbi:GMC family oxidoreductase [Tateyamaria omphalii]|uniref:Choline dehydrogenase n=1 Tax=Tateyamaria omphalii TaxID=299262 RepID=A0A1P8MRC8_9RHOB|nr:GMC family oxidoreductase [Tateyamaria omphalii]APX10572.1 choline dehydrogenase [Tateyamaria omphalii]
MTTTLPQTPDLVVIGAGVAGGLVAKRAAEAGLRVTIICDGPVVARGDLVNRFRNAPDQTMMSPYPVLPHAPQPQTVRTDDYLIQKGPYPYDQQYIRVVGGTTWHWAAATWRYLPNDMKLKTLYGVGRDWPISYDDIEQWYQMAEEEMGVAGPENAPYDAPRSKPYPMGPAPFSYMDRAFNEKLSALGYDHIQAPQARNNQQVYDDRPPCCGNANCMPICPIGAQYSGNMSVEKAQAAGADLITDAVVHHLEVDAEGRITAARYLKPDRSEFRIEASRFVLAANGIEGPKILLMSTQENAPDGVANTSDMVGRNLMDHPGTASAFQSAEPLWPGRGPNVLSAITNLRDGPWRSDMAARKLMILNMNPVAGVTEEAIDEGLTGTALRDAIRHRTARAQVITSFNEQLPDPANRIVPSTEGLTDALGLPRPEIRYNIDDYVHRAAADTRARVEKIAEAMGAAPGSVSHNDGYAPNNHITGATIMGDDPSDSVVDADCRTHDHPNLWIASSSTFPSVSSVNVTLTIAALALRIGESIAAEARP